MTFKSKKSYIYVFYDNKDTVLYVGKTFTLKHRFYQHKKTKDWWIEVSKIEYAICEKSFMVDIYEIYYINLLKPKYNAKDTNITIFKFDYPQLKFKSFRCTI